MAHTVYNTLGYNQMSHGGRHDYLFERAAGIALAMEMATHIAETLRSRSGHVGELTLRQIVKFGGTSLQAATNTKSPWPSQVWKLLLLWSRKPSATIAVQCATSGAFVIIRAGLSETPAGSEPSSKWEGIKSASFLR